MGVGVGGMPGPLNYGVRLMQMGVVMLAHKAHVSRTHTGGL